MRLAPPLPPHLLAVQPLRRQTRHLGVQGTHEVEEMQRGMQQAEQGMQEMTEMKQGIQEMKR